ncbi:putative papain-like cysteine prorease [Anopheles sinensis]|uniref:Putative papain-like cysteine prorease n=1 Tax=Anopheles sinensis TaxID=74873 RepID=A0A084WN85_ANOSI|nr:putative papain-like cysteine prorease [Anopheles sinensis]
MADSQRPDTPGNLEASMLNVIDEVDSCLERILTRRSSITNTARNRNSGNMDSLSPVNETNAEQVHDGILSDNSSDATIELDDDYAAGQLSTSGVVSGSPEDEVMSVDETQSVILPERVPLPRQLDGAVTVGAHEVVPVEEVGTQPVIQPENVPLPRQLRSQEVIDLSDSLTTYSPRAATRTHRSADADVIELSSDEEGPSTSRSTANTAAQPLMHISYSTCTSHPSSQSTNILWICQFSVNVQSRIDIHIGFYGEHKSSECAK